MHLSKNIRCHSNHITYFVFIMLFLFGCQQNHAIKHSKTDTVITAEKPKDTLSTILTTKKDSNLNILSVDASQLPIRLNLEITQPNDQIIVKLENLSKPTINAYLKTEKPMNVRFNQIRRPDNTFDGPFGQTLEYATKQKGEYWLVIAKSNMASGNPLGKFFLKVE